MPFATDRPQSRSLGNRVTLRSKVDAANYTVDPGGLPAFYAGGALLVKGQPLVGWWDHASGVYIIRGPAALQSPATPPGATQGELAMTIPVT